MFFKVSNIFKIWCYLLFIMFATEAYGVKENFFTAFERLGDNIPALIEAIKQGKIDLNVRYHGDDGNQRFSPNVNLDPLQYVNALYVQEEFYCVPWGTQRWFTYNDLMLELAIRQGERWLEPIPLNNFYARREMINQLIEN